MARLVVSQQAQADTAFVLRDLAVTAGHAVAARYAAAFEKLYERWLSFPDSGAPRPAVSPLARIGVVSPYLVIYEFDPASESVTILRIIHGRRRITGRMLFRDSP